MKIPKKISVLGCSWKIIQTDTNPFPERLDDENDFWMGWCNSKDQTIYINTSDEISIAKREQVFLHELTHAIMFESAINGGDYDMNEIYAQCFGNAFHQIFKQML